jgi:methyl-accepting chemotaxis protein
VAQVLQTGEALQGIIGQISQIAQAVGNIADAAQSNAEDLEQVSDTFRILDQSTQQNAAMVEESNAALQALSGKPMC